MDACCNYGLCTKKALPGRPRCREHMRCEHPGCDVKKANYKGDDGKWYCAAHVPDTKVA